MAEFGQPIRNATSDANEGVVNAPSIKREARQVAIPQQKKQASALEIGAKGVGQALGKALQSRLEEEAVNINEQRVLDATIRQGQDHAINQVDANKKRVGWERGIFGQNIEYRAAQQRAVTNRVNATYLEQATSLDDYAGETPEEYSTRLKGRLDNLLEPYQEDSETRALITQSWAASSAKLAAKHYEQHYAYNQQQQRSTFETQTEQHFDMWTVDQTAASSEVEVKAITQQQDAFFSGATKPEGMDGIAWRASVNNVLMKNLREGNIGAYKAAEGNGWFDGMGAKERVAMDKALSVYETKFGNRVDLLFEETDLAASNATTEEEAVAIYQRGIREVGALESRSTGSFKAQKKLVNAKNRITDLAKKGYKAAVKAQNEQARLDRLKGAHRTKNLAEAAGIPKDEAATNKEMQETLDMVILEDIQELVGSEEPITSVDAVAILASDVKVAEAIAERYKGKHTTSPLIKEMGAAFIGGFHNMANEQGQLNEDAIKAMQSLAQFETKSDTFIKTLGKANYDKYQIIKRGMNHRQTVEMITKDLDTFSANVGNREKYAPNWFLGEGETKRGRIESLVRQWIKQTPTGSTLGQYMEDYDRALTLGFGDKDYAEQYLRASVLNQGINYKGHAIPNGNKLNTVTNYGFVELIDAAQKVEGLDKMSMMSPYLMSLKGLKPEDGVVNSLNEVDQLEIYTQEGYDGFFIDSQFAQQPEYIPGSIMKQWAKALDQRKKFKELEQKVSDEAADKWISDSLKGVVSFAN